MGPNSNPSIFLIDRQTAWRERSAQVLAIHGYMVHQIGSYEYPPAQHRRTPRPVDLVVLGCATIGRDEQQLIRHVIDHGASLVVLCSLLTPQTMRTVFLAGAIDVAVKPYDETSLVAIVSKATKAQAALGIRRH